MNFSDAVECLDKGGKVRLKGQKGYYFVGLTESHHMDLFFSTPGLLEPTRVVLTYKEIKTIDWEIVEDAIDTTCKHNFEVHTADEGTSHYGKCKKCGFDPNKQCELVKGDE